MDNKLTKRNLRVLASSIERERNHINKMLANLNYDFTNPLLIKKIQPLEEMINHYT